MRGSLFVRLRSATRSAGLLGVCAWTAGALVACQPKVREFTSDPSSQSSTEGTGELQPGESMGTNGGAPDVAEPPEPGTLGAACSDDLECELGFCVDGVCCESACDGVCQQCSSTGLCDLMPADDDACGTIECPASSECLAYPEELTRERCLALGQCKSAEHCPPSQTSVDQLCESSELSSDVETRCDADGQCVDARQSTGSQCVASGECASGTCREGLCCESACDGVCERCGAEGLCEGVPAGEAVACGEGGRQCFGAGNCLLPSGAVCGSDAECGVGTCQQAVGGERNLACCEQPCGDGEVCSGSGECVTASADLGQACQSSADCALGNCVDGVCCDSPCGGTCETCAAPGQLGRCSAEGATVACDPGEPARRCFGRGQCLLPAATACESGAQCFRNFCEPALAGGPRICCETDCDDATQACNAQGQCEDVPADNGALCSAGSECASGNCDGGRCCPEDCGGPCAICSNRGTCEIPSASASASSCSAVACEAQSTDCRTYLPIGNLCEAVGDCKELSDCPFQNASPDTACTTAGGGRGLCNGNGTCVAVPGSCGDGITEGNEECDDGDTSNTNGCTNACTLARCGDGIVQAGRGEVCDDGGTVSGDGCSADCTVGGFAPVGSHGGTGLSAYCRIEASGVVSCWGPNSNGELGRGNTSTPAEQFSPIAPPVGSVTPLQARSVAINQGTVCALTRTGEVYCWGLGVGPRAQQVPGLQALAQMTTGIHNGKEFCGLMDAGTVLCWGLPNGESVLTEPRARPELQGATHISWGQFHACVLFGAGTTPVCAGDNSSGELGRLPIGASSPEFEAMATSAEVIQLANGMYFNCGLLRSGSVQCTGTGAYLGSPTALPGANVEPVTILGVENAVKVAPGVEGACALTEGGDVYCWGPRFSDTEDPAPDRIQLPLPAVDVGAGHLGACALLMDGSTYCWGADAPAGTLTTPGRVD